MFIIIEGTDASGKTTLIEAVYQELRRRYPKRRIHQMHKGRPAEENRRWVIKDYVLSVEGVNLQRDIVLADRWHWGEATYAPLKRPHTDKDGFGLLGVPGWRWVELFLASRGTARYWLYQPLKVVTKRLNSRGDDYVKADELKDIIKLHKKAAKHSISVTKLQPDADSIDQVADLAVQIVNDAEARAVAANQLRAFPHYVGGTDPRVLIVGDERSHGRWYGKATKLPFIPVDGNSGNYLMSALPERFWRHVGIVNANESPETLLELHEALGSPNVVALGRAAEKTLAAIGMVEHEDYAVLPHPQFVRRFFNRRKQAYGKAIARTAKDITNRGEKWILR